MRAKLSNKRVAILTESKGLTIGTGKDSQQVYLTDEELDKLQQFIGKYLDRYKADGVQDLLNMVNRIAFAMKEKLELKFLDGWDGWQDREREKEFIVRALEHLKKGNILDAINFLTFVWNMEGDKE